MTAPVPGRAKPCLGSVGTPGRQKSGRPEALRRPEQRPAQAARTAAGSGGQNRRLSLAKHVFVTGGVVSSLGKGLTAASLGRILKNRGLRVMIQKLDPYINVDPGAMNPFQHGEVFV